MQNKTNSIASRVVVPVLTALVFAAVAFLLLITVYSADDYWYSVFMDGSFKEWLELMRYHYETFNGRVLVHIAAQAILHFGNWFFALFGTAVCAAIPFFAGRAARTDAWTGRLCALIFGTGLLAMPLQIMSQGLLWISAFCNYALPTAMICGEILLLERVLEKERPGFAPVPACMIAGFLCGATTEQSGLVAACAALFFALVSLFRNRRAFFAAFLTAAAAAGGLLTIFLSGATLSRLERETESGSLAETIEAFEKGFEKQAEILSSSHIVSVLLAIIFVCAGLALARRCAGKAVAVPFVLAAALPLAVPFCTGGAFNLLFGAALALTVIAALALIYAGSRTEALLLLCAVASVLVMCPTESSGGRVLLPFYMYVLAAAALLLSKELEHINPAVSSGILTAAAAAALLAGIPVFKGCWANHETDLINQVHARDAAVTGELYYCIDYDRRYTHTKAYEDGYFYEKYLESVGLDESETAVYFYSEHAPAVYVGDTRLASPAVAGSDGGWLLPLRDIIEGLGGSLDVHNTGITVHFGRQSYELTYPATDRIKISWTDAYGVSQELVVERSPQYFQTVLSENAYSEAFGLTVTEGDNSITVTR